MERVHTQKAHLLKIKIRLIHVISECFYKPKFIKSSSLHPPKSFPLQPLLLRAPDKTAVASHFGFLVSSEQSAGQFQSSCITFPESWPHLLKIAAGIISTLSGGEREGKWSNDMQQRSCTGFEAGACACWAVEMCIDGAGSWPCAWPLLMDELRWRLAKYCRLNIYTEADRQLDMKGWTDRHTNCFGGSFPWLAAPIYLPLKVKHSPIVLWELISCWCSCCYCCCRREFWYSACTVVLILLHERSARIIMARDCKAMPQASLHIIMRWRYDWCQMNTSYLENKTTNDTDILLILMEFWGLGKLLSTERITKLSKLDI